MIFTPEDSAPAAPAKRPRGRRGGRGRSASSALRTRIDQKATQRQRVWNGRRNGDVDELTRELRNDFEALRRFEAGVRDGSV